MLDPFREIKTRVTPAEAARHYGYEPSRSGFVSCPFHSGDRTPSLKLYSDGWTCFGCGAGGSVIDFVGKLFDLAPLDAVRKLNADFSLGLPLDQPPTRAEREAAQKRREEAVVYGDFQRWREDMTRLLSETYRLGWLALRDMPESLWLPGEVEAIRLLPALEHWLDSLGGDFENQMQVFRKRKGVRKICRRILKSIPERFKEV